MARRLVGAHGEGVSPVNSFNSIEKEVIVLKAIQELIDSIVTPELLRLGDEDPTNIFFPSDTHAKLFNILLVDLLSCMDEEDPVEKKPYLRALKEITDNPHFNVNGSVELLRDSTQQFRDWLDTSCMIPKMLLPGVGVETDLETDLELTRLELVKVGGNICRHNVLRSVRIAKTVKQLLCKSGTPVSLDRALLVLSDINKWLHENVFLYHSSSIAEFLNNIRWGIYEYLKPELEKSRVTDEEILGCPSWKYTYPDEVESDYAKECYWELMNEISHKPYIRKFKTTEYLKMRH